MPSTDYFQRPLIPLSLAGFLGTLAAVHLQALSPLWFLFGACAAAAAVLWLRASRAALPLLAAGCFLAYAGLAVQAATPRPNDIGFWAPRLDIMAAGRLGGFPEPAPKYAQWKGVLVCEQVIWRGKIFRVSGKVQFAMSRPMPAWNPGDHILVRGKLTAFDPPQNPGEFDYQEYMARQGVHARLQGRERADAVCLQPVSCWAWGNWAGRLRRRLSRGIRETVPPKAAALTASVVFGDRSGLSRRFQESMAAAGLAHILAVSGMNVSLVLVFLAGLARFIGLPRKLGLVLGAAGVVWFALAAGGSPPVARAAVMAVGAGLGFLAGRRVDPLSGMSLAALVLLAAEPLAGRTASFQLTFAATASILLALPGKIPIKTWYGRMAFGCWHGLRLTGAALLGTAPLTVYYFYSLAPAALVTNLLAGPCVTLTTIGGLCAGLLGAGAPPAGRMIGILTGWSAQALILLAQWAESWPWGRMFLWPGNGWWVLAWYAMFAGACLKKWRWLFIAGAGGLVILYPALKTGAVRPGDAVLTFLALNIGEAACLQAPGRISMLVDTGSEAEFLWRVKPFLAAQGINRLNVLVLTHWDDDHAGGARACAALFRPRLLIHSGWPSPAAAVQWQKAAACGQTELLDARQGDGLCPAPGISMEVLWPPVGCRGRGNQHCLAFCLYASGQRLLFASDSPAKVERQWRLPGPCALLKAGHHGSRSASSSELLLQASPALAVIMPGTRNPYGFPDPEVRRRLGDFCGAVLDTQSRGAVKVRLGKQEMNFETWK